MIDYDDNGLGLKTAQAVIIRNPHYPFFRVVHESDVLPGWRVFEHYERRTAHDRFDMEIAHCVPPARCRIERVDGPKHIYVMARVEGWRSCAR